MIRAERSRVPAMRAGEFVQTMIRADRGDVAAQRLLTAALNAVTSANAPGVLPPTYTTEILGGVDADRTLADLFRSASPLPTTGLTITKPHWTTKPQGGWIADGAATPSSAVQIDAADSQIDQWAFGVLVSYAVMERSSPDFAEAVYREAVNDYYGDVETKIAAALAGLTTAPAATLGAAVAAYVATRRSRPNVLLVGGTVYGEYVDATGPGYPLYTTGAVDASGNITEYLAGLRIVLASFLAPTAALVGHTSALDFREQNPIRLSANVIGTNSVEVGVYSFAYLDVEKPDAFVPITYVPPVALSAGRSSGKSS
jgi:hypothetical protein